MLEQAMASAVDLSAHGDTPRERKDGKYAVALVNALNVLSKEVSS